MTTSIPATAFADRRPSSAWSGRLILNAEHHPGRGTVLLLREAIGF